MRGALLQSTNWQAGAATLICISARPTSVENLYVPGFPSFSPHPVAPQREVSTVGFSKAGRAKVPPLRRDGNTFVFGFQELHCCTSARTRLALFADNAILEI